MKQLDILEYELNLNASGDNPDSGNITLPGNISHVLGFSFSGDTPKQLYYRGKVSLDIGGTNIIRSHLRAEHFMHPIQTEAAYKFFPVLLDEETLETIPMELKNYSLRWSVKDQASNAVNFEAYKVVLNLFCLQN